MKDIIIHFMYFYFTKNGIGVKNLNVFLKKYVQYVFSRQLKQSIVTGLYALGCGLRSLVGVSADT